jgi:hypothetical protein
MAEAALAEAALTVEVREVADLPEAVSHPLDQEAASTGPGPDFPGIPEVFGAIDSTIVILMVMTSSFSVTRSFTHSTGIPTVIIHTHITHTGITRRTVLPTDPTITAVTGPVMKGRFPRL